MTASIFLLAVFLVNLFKTGHHEDWGNVARILDPNHEGYYLAYDKYIDVITEPTITPTPDPVTTTPTPDPTTTTPTIDPSPAGTVDMYRLYNPNSGEHFYTSSIGERDHLISLGWNDEGIGWVAPASSDTPVYRLYNQNGGEHHYTTSVAERDMLIGVGWNDEGIGWYSDDQRRVPLYRQYNPNAFANNHNYTTSQSENDWLVSLGWQAEGIGWYGVLAGRKLE